ncbi:protein rep [Planococcus sp. Sa1BUA13]|uniref:Protein rep n=2 Tax=Planococcus wigleyi TaxID=2762216 RepID=A0ABR8WIE5_9BACL|nr:protein rep [Planococcus wigleyi]
MPKNQDTINNKKAFKQTKLGKDITEKYAPKKDLNRKGAAYMEKHVPIKSIVRFETCSDYISHLTNAEMSVKRVHKTNACENRFCPICTWKTAKKDAIKLSVMLKAVKEIEGKEFLFLTLTSPNCGAGELIEELDRFNKAVSKLFRRRNVQRVVKGYVRKIEVTTDQEQYITEKVFKRKKDYFEMRGLKVGDPNPTYNTYNPHVHAIVVVNKSYFNKPSDFISKKKWLEMWQECMEDKSITQVDVKKVQDSANSNAVLEIAKYSAKGSDLYHSETVFDTFYKALKGRQLLVFSGMMSDYAKKYEKGDLDRLKEKNEDVYTHLLRSLWKGSKYDSKLRELSPEEFEEFNKQAELIEESDGVE